MWTWHGWATVVLAAALSSCSLARGTIGSRPSDAATDGFSMVDVGIDATTPDEDSGLDAGRDADLDGGSDAGNDGGNDSGTDAGPQLPMITGLTLLLDERGQAGVPTVATWHDQSGAGHDLTQTVGNQQPLEGMLVGHPALVWDGVDDCLIGPRQDVLWAPTGMSVTMVFDVSNTATGFAQSLVYATGAQGVSIAISGVGRIRGAVFDGASYAVTPDQNIGAGRHLLQLRLRTGSLSFQLDDNPPVSVAAPLPVMGLDTLLLGASSPVGASAFGGTIAFVAATTGDIDDGQNALLRAYLATIYSVTP